MLRICLVMILSMVTACNRSMGNSGSEPSPGTSDNVTENAPTVPPATDVDVFLKGCGWMTSEEKPERLVVDLILAPSRDFRGLSAVTREQLRAAKTLIVFPFDTNIVRVEVDTADLSFLIDGSKEGFATYAKTVTDYTSFTAHLIVEYTRSVTDDDLNALKSLGAEVYTDPNGTSLSVFASNNAIPKIRELEGVRLTKAREIVCAESNHSQ